MELVVYWKIIWKRLWLLVLLMLIGGSGTAYYTSQLPPRYSSTTTLFLNPAAANTIVNYQVDVISALAATYSEFLKTRSFASDVARELDTPLSEGAIVGALSTTYVPETQFFRITATYGEPEVAQQLANTAAKVLIAKNIARQQEQQEQIRQQSQPNAERERLATVSTTLQNQLDLYEGQIATLQDQLNRLEGQPASDQTTKQTLDAQQRLLSLQSLRQSALTGLAEAQAALANSAESALPNLDTAVVVDAAPLPGGPLPGRQLQSILIALLASLTIGAAIAFLLEYLDYTVKTPEALDTVYGIPAQGVIGLVASQRGEAAGQYQLVTANDPHSPVAEAFRALRTSVQVAGMSQPIHSLLITSAGPGEGKTFVAANLAVSLAQNGLRVILVDADLRRPRVHHVFDLSRETGLTNLIVSQPVSLAPALRPQVRMVFERARNSEALRRRYQDPSQSGKPKLPFDRLGEFLNEVESDDPEVLASIGELRRALAQPDEPARYLQDTQVENLRVLACGPIPPNPAELLGSPRAAQVMQVLGDYADIVIYDSPPAATVTDAAVLAVKVDAVLQVVRAGVTRIDVLRRCRATLAQVGARILGPVLNQVRQSDMGYYKNYYANEYYGEGDQSAKPKHKRSRRKPNKPAPTVDAIALVPGQPLAAEGHATSNGKLSVEDNQLVL
jgi:Mrp family chromosome partitioning ATPase/capsular polysaccharide biosynthesis protein